MYLKDLVDIQMGQSPDSKFYNNDKIGLPFYQGKADFGRINPIPKIWCSKSKKEAKPNDILISVRAPVGDLNINNEQSCIGRGLAAITCKSDVDMMYLYYHLKYLKPQLRHISTGSTFESINRSQLENLIIDYKPYSEQIKISNILQVVQRQIEVREKLLRLYDLLIKSRFVEMFGDLNHNPSYPVVNLKSLIIGSPSNGFFASKELYDKNGKVNLVGVKEVVGNLYTNIYDTPKLNIDDSTLKKYLIDYGDMLFCRSSLVKSGIAKASIVPKSNNKSYIFECHTIKIKLNQQLCIPEFMQVQSEQTYFRNQVIKNSKTATMTTISQQGIVDTKVLLPPVSIQEEFTKFLSQINKLKSDVQKSIDETQLLMDSLMQEYFG